MRRRFLHAADLHIDSPLLGLSAYEGAPVEAARLAPRAAFSNLISIAIERNVAFLLLSGDITDGDNNQISTGLFIASELRRATEAGILVFILWGNHDADAALFKKLPMPVGVRIFSSRKPEQEVLDHLGVSITGQSYGQRAVMDNLAIGYPEAPNKAGLLNIAMLHTSLTGRDGHDPYAPCTEADLHSRGMHYWALGHPHTREVVSRNPWIVIPGNLQGRSVRETGTRGAHLVTYDESGITDTEWIDCSVMHWEVLSIDVGGCEVMPDLLEAIRKSLVSAAIAADGRTVAARIILNGETELHPELIHRPGDLRSQILALAAGDGGRVWIEKVKIDTVRPATHAPNGSALGALEHILGSAEFDAELIAAIGTDLKGITAQLPREVVNNSDLLKEVAAENWTALTLRAAPELRGLIEKGN